MPRPPLQPLPSSVLLLYLVPLHDGIHSWTARGEQEEDTAGQATTRSKARSDAAPTVGAGAGSSEEETVSRTKGKGKGRVVPSPPRPPIRGSAAVASRNSAASLKATGVRARNTASLQSEVVISNGAPAASGPAVCRSEAVGGDDDAGMSTGAASSGVSDTEVVLLADNDGRWPGQQRPDDSNGGPVGLAPLVGEGGRRAIVTMAVSCGLVVGDDDLEGGESNPPGSMEGAAEVNNASDDDSPSSRYFRVCHPYFLGGAVQRTGRGVWGGLADCG